MGKRKREQESSHSRSDPSKKPFSAQQTNSSVTSLHLDAQEYTSLQIITGSYDRILHGIIATVPKTSSSSSQPKFTDNFLFYAHSSAIRCLALSPPDAKDSKLILASGGTDERINLYTISTSLPLPSKDIAAPPSLPKQNKAENHENREIGTLLHHSSNVNVLYFPNRAKLISGSDDNTIAISRTRDWTVLSTVKAPIPKAPGRPSGDTAPPGGTPAGINDFAIHPSLKLMISVGKGEKCMRLWNLVTGKKASVLNFEKELLHEVGEGKWSRSEGRKVEWNADGHEFAVAFERGAIVYGMVGISKPVRIQ
jgi:protein MAK11